MSDAGCIPGRRQARCEQDGRQVSGNPLMQERYGRRVPGDSGSRGRLLLLIAGPAVLLVLALGFISWVTVVRRPDVSWQDLSFDVRSDAEVQVTFDLAFSGRAQSRARPGRATAICTVDALNELQTEVGLQDVRIQAGPAGRARATVTLPTSERAVTGLVKACTVARH